MNVLLTIVLAVQMLSALGMIGLILVQHGKGADMGAAFGSGGSGSLFGASGSANFLSRTTAVLAARVLRLHAGAGLLRQRCAPVESGSVLERAASRRRRRRLPLPAPPQIPARPCAAAAAPRLLRCRRRRRHRAPRRSRRSKRRIGCRSRGRTALFQGKL